MSTRTLFALLLSAGLAATVQAHESSADFWLDPVTGLSSGESPAPGSVGQWLTPNSFAGTTTVYYTWADGSRSTNQDTYTSAGLPRATLNGEPFGPRREQTMPALAADSPSAHSLVEPGHLQAGLTREHPWDEANAGASWERTFSLLPNTSITFSGTAILHSDQPTTKETTFEASPNLNPQYANRGVLSLHSLLDDRWDNGISIVARIMNFDPRLPGRAPLLGRIGSEDDFAYSSDEQGHVSFTLFNHSNDLMFTSLSIGASAVAPYISPIPEPAAWSAMLLGLGVLAWRRMKLRKWLTVFAAVGLAGVAHAENVTLDFALDPITGLSTDSSAPAGTVGHWIGPNAFSGTATAVHYWADQSTSFRQNSFYSGTLAGNAAGDQPFGNYSRGVDAVAADAPSVQMTVAPGHLHSEVSRPKDGDSADGYLTWKRAFTLDPNSSITLSGLLTLESSMPLSLMPAFSTTPKPLDTVANSAWLSFRDDASWGWNNGISIIGNILNQDPRDFHAPLLGREPGPDDFAYSTDPQGHLSLTIFNRSNQSMFGSFEVWFVAAVDQMPIPEPSTWLAMLVGLGVLSWRCRQAVGGWASRSSVPC
jgi:hypothetical protein